MWKLVSSDGPGKVFRRGIGETLASGGGNVLEIKDGSIETRGNFLFGELEEPFGGLAD